MAGSAPQGAEILLTWATSWWVVLLWSNQLDHRALRLAASRMVPDCGVQRQQLSKLEHETNQGRSNSFWLTIVLAHTLNSSVQPAMASACCKRNCLRARAESSSAERDIQYNIGCWGNA